MKIRVSSIAAALLCLSLSLSAQTTSGTATPATATVPRLITFSGTLSHVAIAADQNGVVLAPSAAPTQVVAITFSLYAEQEGGTPLWSEVQNVHVDSGGRYTVHLGASKPDGLPMDIFTSVEAHWLGVQPQDHAEQPRVLLVSVPYALKSGDAETFGGLPPSAFVLAPPSDANLPPGKVVGGEGKGGEPAKGPHHLPVSGGGTPNYLPLWTTASSLASSALYQDATSGKIGVGTTTPQGKLDVTTNSDLIAVTGQNLATSGSGVGTGGHTKGPTGIGVFGVHDSATGAGMGVSGLTMSPAGVGVLGVANTPTGSAFGVSGTSASSDGVGVYGLATAPGAAGHASYGVKGQSRDPDGAGGGFANTAVSGQAVAVGGITGSSSGGRAVNGVGVTPSTTQVGLGNGITVGVWGDTGESAGVGVVGTADGGVAVGGTNNSTANAAGYFENTATSGSPIGLTGKTDSSTGIGVYGTSPGGIGVSGVNTTSGYGVYGSSVTGVGIQGTCAPTGSNFCYNGVAGLNTSTSGSANGLWGLTMSPQGNAVYMVNSGGGNLLFGTQSNGGNATFYVQGNGSGYFGGNLQVNGQSTFNSAVQINGNLTITGNLIKGSGSFKIDDPLDPANKYLSHSFVESPDMMNIYNGNVTTDKRGLANVVLPNYFDALNRDFRYQLTVIGQFAQAIVAKEIQQGRFTIRTNKPGVKVSWQVTGIRQDAFANAHRIPNEEDKPAAERGYYLHPELFGAPESQAIHNARVQHPPNASSTTDAHGGN